MIQQRLAQLRNVMKDEGLSAYIIPTADFHQSEYVGDYFMARKYMSGFTGSAGVLVVAKEAAGLWTDGRYFIQAERQLRESGITLFRQGEPNVASIEEFLMQQCEEMDVVGFDGRVLDVSWGSKLKEELANKKITVQSEGDLIDGIWVDRPSLSIEPVFVLEDCYAGENASSKIARLRKAMAEEGATVHLITSLDDIAWLLNIRGNDVLHNPVVLSYVAVTDKEVYLFIDEKKVTEEVATYLNEVGVSIKSYNEVYEFTKNLSNSEVLLYDKSKLNYALYTMIPDGVKTVVKPNPTILMKAVKNDTEIANLREAHIKDGVAFTKFMYWLKKNIGQLPMTEITASDYIEEQRKQQEGFISLSFDTISAYRENAAMMHYSATEESHAVLEPVDLLLVDSGGQYYQGTTDITRTMALGEVTQEQKEHYTAVVRSMLNLQAANFLSGCRGVNLDVLARGPIWDIGMDYRCGTGHGVGYLLNVHEGPNGFRWKPANGPQDSAVLLPGMVTTDEPGIYIEGSHGIRIENQLVCVEGPNTEYGQFLRFESLTMAPIDLDALDLSKMYDIDKERLNAYHKEVYEKLSPYLTSEENEWLKEYTREIC